MIGPIQICSIGIPPFPLDLFKLVNLGTSLHLLVRGSLSSIEKLHCCICDLVFSWYQYPLMMITTMMTTTHTTVKHYFKKIYKVTVNLNKRISFFDIIYDSHA